MDAAKSIAENEVRGDHHHKLALAEQEMVDLDQATSFDRRVTADLLPEIVLEQSVFL